MIKPIRNNHCHPFNLPVPANDNNPIASGPPKIPAKLFDAQKIAYLNASSWFV